MEYNYREAEANKDSISYDIEAAKKLVGTVIKEGDGPFDREYYIESMHHDYFHIIFTHNLYHTFMQCKDILKTVQDIKFVEEVKSNNPIQDVFDKRGGFVDEWTSGFRSFVVGGHPNVLSKTDMGTDERVLICSLNSTDGFLEIGKEYSGSYYHTFKKSDDTTWGYSIKGGHRNLDLDAVEWIDYKELEETAWTLASNKLIELIGFDRDYYIKESKDGTFVFWDERNKVAWKYAGIVDNEDSKKYLNFYKGNVLTNMTATKSGSARNGRRASWGYKWTLSKTATLITGEELKTKIFDIAKPIVAELFSITPTDLAAKNEAAINARKEAELAAKTTE